MCEVKTVVYIVVTLLLFSDWELPNVSLVLVQNYRN